MIKSLFKFGSAIVGKIAWKTRKTQRVLKSLPSEELFCHKYWEMAEESGRLNSNGRKSVELSEYLHSINHHLIKSPYPKTINEIQPQVGLTPRQIITKTDFDFRRLVPIEEDMHVYRCIGEKPEFFSEYPLYQKALKVKKGDVIMMREYAYAAETEAYSKNFLANNKGILYDIEVPKGSRISRAGDVVFPRSSRFECLDTRDIITEDANYKLVKLRYLV